MTEGNWQLAEVNVARLDAPLESPAMAGLVRALADVNWLAEQSPGFVWRHRADPGPLTFGRLDGGAPERGHGDGSDGEVVVTLSVWTHYAALQRFVYRTAHVLFMQRRSRWFQPIGGFTTALWWVAEGDEPPIADALSRLDHLRAHGPTPHAFSLRQQFDAAGVAEGKGAPGPPRDVPRK